MPCVLKRATMEDLPLLVSLRLEVLRSANRLPIDASLEEIEENICAFLRDGFDSQSTLLAYDGGALAGCGSVCFYKVLPTCDCPNGIRAYIMSMYTREAYRRRGIASAVLLELVEEARRKGADSIALEATDMGRPLYEKHGFVSSENEMYLQK